MLGQRIITAVVLLAILLPALFYRSPEPFCMVALVLIGAAGWEWGRLNACGQKISVLFGLTVAFFCGVAWVMGLLDRPLPTLWILAGSVWVLVGSWLLRVGVAGWSCLAKSWRLVGGVAALVLAWLAVAQARVIGVPFLLSVLLLVWVADIFAYAAGRALGGRFTNSKLAPSISSGKSWEGVWGGMAGVVILATSWVWLDRSGASGLAGSLYAYLLTQHGFFVMLIGALFLAAMSVVGDLVESLVKRSAGAKDSSGLLPGHGGVLDRIDALLPAVPLAMMLVSL